jgi:hypothetical protein
VSQLRFNPVVFVPASELCARVPAEPTWVLQGYLARGAITYLAGRPKVGKSTLVLGLVEAIATGAASYLGRTVRGGPVVFGSEESERSLAHKLPSSDRISVLTREGFRSKPTLYELICASIEEAQRVGAMLLVLDTLLPFWAGLAGDRENATGDTQTVMEALLPATRTGLAVLGTGHQRKTVGADGEGIKGSASIAGAADIVLELERTNAPRDRLLLALSRYPSTPGSLVVRHDAATGMWSAVAEGERTDARAIGDRLSILDALARGDELTRTQLEDAVGAPQRQWHEQLDELIREGRVGRLGAGKKGNPHRFRILRADGAQDPRRNGAGAGPVSAAHPFRGAAETNHRPDGAQHAEQPDEAAAS